MADFENQHESSSFPVKRKSDLCCQDQENVANKAHKLDDPSSISADTETKDGESNGIELENLDSMGGEKIGAESSISPEKVVGDLGGEDEQEDGDGDGDEDEEEEEDDCSIEAEIDRKGKGISREDKGKGKLIEVDESEDEEDDSDDDDDDGDGEDDSDLSDDPLAEVDLDNILPSRTRRRSIQPGVYISEDRGGNNNNEDDDDDDSSDDSDA